MKLLTKRQSWLLADAARRWAYRLFYRHFSDWANRAHAAYEEEIKTANPESSCVSPVLASAPSSPTPAA